MISINSLYDLYLILYDCFMIFYVHKIWLIFFTEFNSDGSKKSVELKIVNLQMVGEAEFNMKRWEEIGVWQTGIRTDPNKTEKVAFSTHEGNNNLV